MAIGTEINALDDLDRPLHTVFHNKVNKVLFGAHHENLKENKPIHGKNAGSDSSFWQCNVYDDIRGRSMKTKRKTTL